MSEEQTNTEATGQTEPTPQTTPAPAVSNSDVRNSELFQRVTSELAEARKQIEDIGKKSEEAQAAKLKEKEQYKELYESTEAKLSKVQAEANDQVMAAMSKLVTTELNYELRGVGITDDIARRGYIATYNEIEGDKPAPAEWIEQLKQENPERFNIKASGKSTGSVGTVSQHGSGQSLDERLQSTDTKTYRAAWKEKFGSIGR
jgi:hypothetical protein